MPVKKIKDSIYPITIHCVYREPIDSTYQYLKKEGYDYGKEKLIDLINDCEGVTFWLSSKSRSDICLIFTKKIASVEVFAHEVFHVVEHVMREIGLPLTYESSEAYAYYIGWLTSEVVTFLKTTEKRSHTMKTKKPLPKAFTEAQFKKHVEKDKKDDMKMIKTAIKKNKRK